MSRANYMTATQKSAMGELSRTHQNCIDKTGVGRPGKTAHDRARGVLGRSRHGVPEVVETKGKRN